jgi:hypothetical protein
MNELRDVANHINLEGLPSRESMRADIEANNRVIAERPIYQKLDQYRSLYDRFTKGEDLTDDEIHQMTNLAKELEELASQN